MFWDVSNNLRAWGDDLRKKRQLFTLLGDSLLRSKDLDLQRLMWLIQKSAESLGQSCQPVVFNAIKYFLHWMSYLMKSWKESPFMLSSSQAESPNIWKQLQMECCELGKNKKERMGNEPLIMKMLSKNKIWFFGLDQNDGFLARL